MNEAQIIHLASLKDKELDDLIARTTVCTYFEVEVLKGLQSIDKNLALILKALTKPKKKK